MAVEKKNASLEKLPNTEIYANSAFFCAFIKKIKIALFRHFTSRVNLYKRKQLIPLMISKKIQ